jgi:hypothetical protein
LAPSLTIFPDPVRTLAILLLLGKCERFYFNYRNCCQTKSFRLRTVNFSPKNPICMLYQ